MFYLYLYVIKAFKGGQEGKGEQEGTRRARFIQEGRRAGGQEGKLSQGGQEGGRAGGQDF